MPDSELEVLADKLENQLMDFYGAPLLKGVELQRAMGYPSISALRQAILRNNFPIPIFSLPKRKGKYALVKDIAKYLATHRTNSTNETLV